MRMPGYIDSLKTGRVASFASLVLFLAVGLLVFSAAAAAARADVVDSSHTHECVDCSVCAAFVLEMQAVLQNGPLQEPSSSAWLQASDLPTSDTHLIVGRWTPLVVRSRRLLSDALHMAARAVHGGLELLGLADDAGGEGPRAADIEAVRATIDELVRSLQRRGLAACLREHEHSTQLLQALDMAVAGLVPPRWWRDAQCGPYEEGDVARQYHPFSADPVACLHGSSAVVRAAADGVARSHRWPSMASMARLSFVGRTFVSAEAAKVRDGKVQEAVTGLLTPARRVLLQATGNTLRTVRSGAVALLESEAVYQAALKLTGQPHSRADWHKALRAASLDALAVSSCDSWCSSQSARSSACCFSRLFPGNSVINLTSSSSSACGQPEAPSLQRVAVHAVLSMQLAHVNAMV